MSDDMPWRCYHDLEEIALSLQDLADCRERDCQHWWFYSTAARIDMMLEQDLHPEFVYDLVGQACTAQTRGKWAMRIGGNRPLVDEARRLLGHPRRRCPYE